MADDPSLVTLDEVKAFIRTKSGYTANDAQYLDLAVKATKLCEQWCRRTFSYQEYTQYFDTRQSGKVALDLYGFSRTGYTNLAEHQKFYLAHTPVDPSVNFRVSFDPFYRVWDTPLESSKYWVVPESGELTVALFSPRTSRSLQVIYTAGYGSANRTDDDISYATLSDFVPEDLKLACLMTVVNLFNRTQDRLFGLKSDPDAGKNGAVFDHYGIVPPEAREILMPYRKMFIGKN